jgi:para-nitrobenzyl esterase
MTIGRISHVFVAAVLAAVPFAVQAQTVRIETGQLRGATAAGVASWKGVPFAAPPVGPLRWRSPQPASRWSGVRDSTAYQSDCMQKPFGGDAAPLGTAPAEDCLYANVWRPAKVSAKLPVIVWIYGGGFVNGGASPPTYSGANLARQGVMFVSFNYRVGRFGTFAFPQLRQEGEPSGDFSILDQIAALKWVRRNIAAFGGDPGNVTIIGESAGGMSVHALVTTPLARGLFHKAVVMSGGAGDTAGAPDLATAERGSVDFARSKGIAPDDPRALAKLRALPGEAVVDGLNLADRSPNFTGPYRDDRVVVDQRQAYRGNRFSHVPMLIGATSADIGGRTGFMVAGARIASATIAAQGVPVWEYRFSYVADSIGKPGAQHASDIPFFFDNAAIKYGAATTQRDVTMGKTISAYLVNFARTGDPNGKGLPRWPRYQAASDPLMDFAADGRAVPQKDPWGAEIDAAAPPVR